MGLRVTSMVLISTSTLSQKPGRVKMAGVSIADCLSGGVHPSRECYFWALPYHLLGATLVCVLHRGESESGLGVLFAGDAGCLSGVYRSYRLYIGRLETLWRSKPKTRQPATISPAFSTMRSRRELGNTCPRRSSSRNREDGKSCIPSGFFFEPEEWTSCHPRRTKCFKHVVSPLTHPDRYIVEYFWMVP
jgi:hypothetical protein